MFDLGSLASHSSQHIARCSLSVSHHKGSHLGCLSGPLHKGLPLLHLTLWLLWCVLCRQGFSSSVCQLVVGATQASTAKVYQQCWKEWVGFCAQNSASNNTISAPTLANSLLDLFRARLPWCTIGIYLLAIPAFVEPHHHHKTTDHPIISKLMCIFYLNCPL